MTGNAVKDAKEALDAIIMGMTHPENKCWPTVKAWTKKERDEQILIFARKARAILEADCK